MKVATYGICGPGETAATVDRMVRSADDADMVIVLMTCDNEAAHDAATEAGAIVRYADFAPFRFDDARNAALAMVPLEIDACIAMDMDETLEPGWREEIEFAYNSTPSSRTWSAFVTFDFNGEKFLQNNRVHSRQGWRWKHTCHEALVQSLSGDAVSIQCPGLVMTHRPDETKPRPNYLNLLAWGQFEDPTSTRMLHYYGRELMFAGYYKDALERFDAYLAAPPNFPAEVKQTMMYVHQCKAALDDGQ